MRMNFRRHGSGRLVAMAVGLLCVASTARAGAPEKVTTVEGIAEYRLENGLRVLLFPDPTRPKVTVNLTVLVGCATRDTARPAWRTCSSTCSSRGRRPTPTSPAP